MENQTHLSVLRFVNSLTENRVFRMTALDGKCATCQFKKFDSGRIYFVNITKALKDNKVPGTNSISINRIKTVKSV